MITMLPPLQCSTRGVRGVRAVFPETDHVGNGHRSQYSDDSIAVIIEMSGRFQGYEPVNQAPQLGRYQFAVLLIDSTGGREILACTRQHLVCIRERLSRHGRRRSRPVGPSGRETEHHVVQMRIATSHSPDTQGHRKQLNLGFDIRGGSVEQFRTEHRKSAVDHLDQQTLQITEVVVDRDRRSTGLLADSAHFHLTRTMNAQHLDSCFDQSLTHGTSLQSRLLVWGPDHQSMVSQTEVHPGKTIAVARRRCYNFVMHLASAVPALRSRKTLALVTLCFAVFVVNVSTTIVNIALPTLVGDLGASTRDLLWIVDAFNLAFAALVLAAGSLSDRFGRRLFLLGGLTLFAIASLGGAWSSDPGQLIAWRALAGVAAAIVYPVTLSILTNVFTERSERVAAIGIWGAATGVSVAVGPVVGGALIEHFWWGSILVFNGAAALFTLLMATRTIPDSRDPSTPPLDKSGLILSTMALGSLVHAIIEAPDRGWGSRSTTLAFALAAVLLTVFVYRESRARHPMLDVRLFKNMRFTAASGAVTSAFFAMFGFIFLVTQYFQSVRSFGALETGVRMLPVAGALAAFSLVSPRLAVTIGSKLVVASGLVSLTAAFVWISTIDASTGYGQIAGQMILLGAGLGLISAPATEAIMGVVPTDKAGMGSAVNDATRELGGTLGVAVIGSVALSVYRDSLESTQLPPALMEPARESVGAALAASQQAATAFGDAGTRAALELSDLARTAFVDGFTTGSLVAGVVTAVAAVLILIFLPAHPNQQPSDDETSESSLPQCHLPPTDVNDGHRRLLIVMLAHPIAARPVPTTESGEPREPTLRSSC